MVQSSKLSFIVGIGTFSIVLLSLLYFSYTRAGIIQRERLSTNDDKHYTHQCDDNQHVLFNPSSNRVIFKEGDNQPKKELKNNENIEQVEQINTIVKTNPINEPVATPNTPNTPNTPKKAAKKVSKQKKGYIVQIGIFTEKNNAQRLGRELNNNGYKTTIKKITWGNQPRYQLSLGPYVKREQALKISKAQRKISEQKGIIKEAVQ